MLTPTCGFQILFVARQIYEGDHFRRFLAHLNAQEAIEQESLKFSNFSQLFITMLSEENAFV